MFNYFAHKKEKNFDIFVNQLVEKNE